MRVEVAGYGTINRAQNKNAQLVARSIDPMHRLPTARARPEGPHPGVDYEENTRRKTTGPN
jgi:hypothetical protein